MIRKYLSRLIKGLCCLIFIASVAGCSSQPVTSLQAAIRASGFYTITVDGKEETVAEDEVFVLQSVGTEWKVTEKYTPGSNDLL